MRRRAPGTPDVARSHRAHREIPAWEVEALLLVRETVPDLRVPEAGVRQTWLL